MTIRDDIRIQPFQGFINRKIARKQQWELLSMSLETGAVFPEHHSPVKAWLVVIQGALDFHMEGKVYALETQDFIEIPARIAHCVTARENSKFLVIR